jgi:uncharacterized membrane protein YfcA
MTLLDFPHIFLLFASAFLGGALNSVAGGGSFFSFPALVFSGVPPINANTTNTLALWPGSLASAGAYRRELVAQRSIIIKLGLVSLVGGVIGAILLIKTSQQTFVSLLPFLLLLATVLFIASPRITAFAKKQQITIFQDNDLVSMTLQFLISIYGGYFGGGIGIMMLAAFSLMGMQHIHQMNALKTFMASIINGIAVITFIIAGSIFWAQAILMLVGAIIGGYGGAVLARRIEQRYIRWFIIATGSIMTIYFFIRR